MKYIYTLIALVVFIPVFWGGIVFTFLEGDDHRIGLGLLLVSALIWRVSDILIKRRCNYSILQIACTNTSLTAIQLLLLGLTCVVLIMYGTIDYEDFNRHRWHAGMSESLDVEDPAGYEYLAMIEAYNHLGNAIIQFAGVVLILLVVIVQAIKYRKSRRLAERGKQPDRASPSRA